MIRTGKKFSKPEMSRVINGDKALPEETQAVEKIRLDLLMSEIFKSYNRSTIQKFIEYGFVTVNGELVKKPNTKFERDVKIGLRIPQVMKNADLVPETIYEDKKVLVVNKPAGLLSMAKGEYCPENTLEHYGLLVHRLDRDTSGVMILAKDEETQRFLKKQFQERKAHKTYIAVVVGSLRLKEARIDLPMARDLKRPTTFKIDPNGKEAETFYKVLKENEQYSMVELRPTTGRTHQLRVHLKYLGHPILGDTVYGDGKAERLFLHAKELEITLPGGVRKTFVAPLPKDFENVFR
ncbi:RluA family pseudouridine synthase [Candidatus Saccharibacteria bacterium]|nr:RluA family pseudouridine synthase [Candidatus Saccharibacteria bacterium]